MTSNKGNSELCRTKPPYFSNIISGNINLYSYLPLLIVWQSPPKNVRSLHTSSIQTEWKLGVIFLDLGQLPQSQSRLYTAVFPGCVVLANPFIYRIKNMYCAWMELYSMNLNRFGLLPQIWTKLRDFCAFVLHYKMIQVMRRLTLKELLVNSPCIVKKCTHMFLAPRYICE